MAGSKQAAVATGTWAAHNNFQDIPVWLEDSSYNTPDNTVDNNYLQTP